MKERPNLLVEVKAKTYYCLKTIGRKYGHVETILMHLQNAPIYYAKYKKKKGKLKH